MLGNITDYPDNTLAFDYLAFDTDFFYRCSYLHGCIPLMWQIQSKVRISGPLSVIATVCSKCADNRPSTVTDVHPSANTFTSYDPSLTIGSIASTMPALSFGPLPGTP